MATPLLLLQAGGPSGITSILASPAVMLMLLFGVFYFLLIRPQQKRQRALQDLVAQLKAGDRIITTGGIIATVTAVREGSLIVRSADKSMLEITRGAVAGLQSEEPKS
jgi:preprotein translocase subunit YajC